MNEKTTAAVTPISSHRRFERKTAEPVTIKPLIDTNPEELLDMDSVAATQHIRVCSWLLAHRHGRQDAIDVLEIAIADLRHGFKP